MMDELSLRDNIREAFLQLQGDRVFAGGRVFANLSIAKGLGGAFGGSEGGSAYTSRIDASNNFFRTNIDFVRYQPLDEVSSAVVRVSGQWSPDNLLASEEWLIGGADSVHGYSIGEGAGDSGYFASLSLRSNPLQNKEGLQVAAFFDYGYSCKRNIFPGGEHKTVLSGFGVGLSSRFMSIAPTSLRLDLGFPINPSTNHIDENPVLYLQTSIRL